MSVIRSFGAITGLYPFSLNRVSFITAFSIATLVITKLVDAYLFCGFNTNFFVDLPIGVILFFGYCMMPLLGLAVNRKPTTKGGRCCRIFAIVLICIWQLMTLGAILSVALLAICSLDTSKANSKPGNYDPFNVCGNRTVDNVRTQFRNAMPAFDIFQEIDQVVKFVVAVCWTVLIPWPFAVFAFFGHCTAETSRKRQACEDPEYGKSTGECDETIVCMKESSEEPVDVEDESAPDDAAREAEDRKSEIGSVDVRMENLRNEINESGSSAKSQWKEAKGPKFSIVDEKEEEAEEATATKSANEDSK